MNKPKKPPEKTAKTAHKPVKTPAKAASATPKVADPFTDPHYSAQSRRDYRDFLAREKAQQQVDAENEQIRQKINRVGEMFGMVTDPKPAKKAPPKAAPKAQTAKAPTRKPPPKAAPQRKQ